MKPFIRNLLVRSQSLCYAIAVALLLLTSDLKAQSVNVKSSESVLEKSKREFKQDHFDAALRLLKIYFAHLCAQPTNSSRAAFRFYTIAMIGQIYLEKKQDPNGALQWFGHMEDEGPISGAERDIIDGWTVGVKDWIRLGKFPRDISDPNTLFDLGKKYYESGLTKQKYPNDFSGSADFNIASGYLVPFIVHNDKDPKIGDALFMMGDIRRLIWVDTEIWSPSYYLTEVIRRYPGTPVAGKAYIALDKVVHSTYTESSGDHTPPSWITLLSELKKLAQGRVLETPPPYSTHPVN